MNSTPTVSFDEFQHYTTHTAEQDGYHVTERTHPDFGSWHEKFVDLAHIRVYQHRADLRERVNVSFNDGTVDKYVHHCMSIEGELGAHFTDYDLSAVLSPRSFHNLFLPGDEYFLAMGSQFLNVHIEVQRDHYAGLLSDDEKWSSTMKAKLYNNEVFYPGEFQLSIPMLQTIHAIFDCSLSGALKKLLIEAKVHELIALQLHGAQETGVHSRRRPHRDLFVSIQEHLDKTFLEDHSLKAIARHFGINEFLLKKGFREHFDTTVFEYLLNKRLAYGHLLLQSTGQSIHEISGTVGYRYPNHFSAAFKKKYGITPAELRKR